MKGRDHEAEAVRRSADKRETEAVERGGEAADRAGGDGARRGDLGSLPSRGCEPDDVLSVEASTAGSGRADL